MDKQIMNTLEYIPSKAFHPGITLREKLDEMEMSVKEFALRTSKPEKTINAVLVGDSSVTPDMSVAFEKVTKIPARMWLNLQRSYDEYIARKKQEALYSDETVITWAKLFPYPRMVEKGWVPAARTMREKIDSLFSFFEITSVKAWEDYYLNQQLKVAFRISLSVSKNPHAISAWLRQGEILAREIKDAADYDENKLKQAIPLFLQLTEQQPADFSIKLKEICSSVGIKLVYVAHIPHAPLNGCVRWIGDHPCIQLSDKQKTSDVFWFSFFHEIGHIIHHGKKDVFLESADFQSNESDKEKVADTFASNILLPPKVEQEILANNDFSAETILYYAQKFKTHPGIIVGRLQHKRIIPFSALNGLKAHIDIFN